MGLLNARNLRRAKQLLDKNRHKVGDVVEKAGTKLDEVSKGKTSNVTSKAAGAAKKYSAGGVTHHGMEAPAPDLTPHGDPMAAEAAKVRQSQATATAANAVAGAANALTNLMNKAAAKAETTNTSKNDASVDATAGAEAIEGDELDRG